jgi:hypothetical protein
VELVCTQVDTWDNGGEDEDDAIEDDAIEAIIVNNNPRKKRIL